MADFHDPLNVGMGRSPGVRHRGRHYTIFEVVRGPSPAR
jgi:hypothetical protein